MIFAATADGVHNVETGEVILAGCDVGFFARGAGDTSWSIVAGRRVMRDAGRGWSEVARLDRESGLVAHPIGKHGLLVCTTGAHLVRVGDDHTQLLASFDDIPGRYAWTNPAAGGRPDVWSFASDGNGIFVSVHVGGLWRSEDDTKSWTNVLVPQTDVHQVAATASMVAVAAQRGFGFSRDRGESWSWTTECLHAPYLQCLTLTDDAVYVGASSGPFADDAAVYRASPPGSRFERRSEGLPDAFEAIGPYHLVADGDNVALAAWFADTVFVSRDSGGSWAPVARQFPSIRGLVAA